MSTKMTVKAVCADCRQEFDAKVLTFLGVKKVAKCCPECSHKNIVAFYEGEKTRTENEQAEMRRNWLYASGIPAHYHARTFDAFDRAAQPKAYDACLEYAKEFPQDSPGKYRSLVLTSPKAWGVGKTHLVCAIAHYVIDHRPTDSWRMCPVKVTTESELFARIQATFNRKPFEQEGPPAETESGIINLLCRVPLLVLDDVGKVERNDPRFVQRTLFAIINGRYNNDLPMVVTANLTDTQLREYLGGVDNQASLDRLLEMCDGKVIQMSGKTWRRK